VVVTNPLDAMAQAAFRVSGFPKNRVLGMAGVLDSGADERVCGDGVQGERGERALVCPGGHGDDMVPLPRYRTGVGDSFGRTFAEGTIDSMWSDTRKGGAEDCEFAEDGVRSIMRLRRRRWRWLESDSEGIRKRFLA